MRELNEAIKKSPDGAHLDLFVKTNADKNCFPIGFNKWRKRIEIKVCSEAKDNKANLDVIREVAKFFNKSIKDVFIISGEKNKEKTILIRNISKGKVIKSLQGYFDEL